MDCLNRSLTITRSSRCYRLVPPSRIYPLPKCLMPANHSYTTRAAQGMPNSCVVTIWQSAMIISMYVYALHDDQLAILLVLTKPPDPLGIVARRGSPPQDSRARMALEHLAACWLAGSILMVRPVSSGWARCVLQSQSGPGFWDEGFISDELLGLKSIYSGAVRFHSM
jgi:hypothetical protein